MMMMTMNTMMLMISREVGPWFGTWNDSVRHSQNLKRQPSDSETNKNQ